MSGQSATNTDMSVVGGLAAAFARGRRVTRKGYTQLTSKFGPRTFYKGKGCLPTGTHTRKGRGGREMSLLCWETQVISRDARWATILNALPLCLHAGGYVATKERLPVFLVPDLTKVEVRRVWFADGALLSVLGARRAQAQRVPS